jgi:hypothetical protein
MRFLTLYLRSRRVPAAAATVLASVAVLWFLGTSTDDPQGRLPIAVLALSVGMSAIAPGLAGADLDLDRTAAIRWPPRRAAHVLAGAVLVTAALAATALTGDPMAPFQLILRDALGLAGLVALGAATLGAGRAWLLPVTWSLVTMVAGARNGSWPRELLTWAAQPEGTTSATVTAVVLGGAGILAYAAAGSRR